LKSLLAREIARVMFSNKILELDMGEYVDQYTASSLIGAPQGYIGYGNGGILTNHARYNPSSVIVFNNIELAHSRVHEIISGILDNGVLKDMDGRDIDFSGVLIILTSTMNIKRSAESIGFRDTSTRESDIEKKIRESISSKLIDRTNVICVLNDLTLDDMREIVQLEIQKAKRDSKGPKISLTASAVDFILDKRDKKSNSGARDVQKLIRYHILDNVSNIYMVDTSITEVKVDTCEGKLTFNPIAFTKKVKVSKKSGA